ncbi:hypothetical protein BO85DRAFT_156078 [Aspergillus piperis CBS 112811]|uniref:Transmembrane protein n=1 Tax=Aspergillus piperis CBS 112811 TaxID=1448313 RepID=A0A8G1QUQ4_9EURO|nr:hypothetical protein BO85DRAFT_156078 [Aspergillus piperis CBS 112811]RAH53326.1 hypothetical protein BO85DRAFT_156078 [Aspergillus piperis CBS 112811]
MDSSIITTLSPLVPSHISQTHPPVRQYLIVRRYYNTVSDTPCGSQELQEVHFHRGKRKSRRVDILEEKEIEAQNFPPSLSNYQYGFFLLLLPFLFQLLMSVFPVVNTRSMSWQSKIW